ncbi:MAG: hypothetical protein RI591_06765, partial [Dehalococcoidia bacterium]|nr:hypothetical protein [Dehalococcoidia bacterium]
QEFECSWAANIPGAIYGKELEELFDGPVAEVATDEIRENQSEGVTEDSLAEPGKSVEKHD